MASRTITMATIGWDAATQGPVCALTLTYDDVTFVVASARVVNISTDMPSTLTVVDLNRAPNHPQRERSFVVEPGMDRTKSLNITGEDGGGGVLILPRYEVRFGGSGVKARGQ